MKFVSSKREAIKKKTWSIRSCNLQSSLSDEKWKEFRIVVRINSFYMYININIFRVVLKCKV